MACENTSHYAYQKCFMFWKVFEEIPCEQILREEHEDWFEGDDLLEMQDNLSWPVRTFLDDYSPIWVSSLLMFLFSANTIKVKPRNTRGYTRTSCGLDTPRL